MFSVIIRFRNKKQTMKKEASQLNKVKGILKQKNGASLLLVLACMFFLITIAATTLKVSLGSASVTQTQKDKTSIDLLAESVQTTLQDMLNVDVTTPGADNLQTVIVKSVYEYSINPTANQLFDSLNLSFDEIITNSDGTTDTVTHSFECELDTSQLQVNGDEVSGVVDVFIEIDLDEQDISLTGEATYRMSFRLDKAEFDGALSEVSTYGEWILVAYEKIER